ncbi:MAG: 4Fe-4S dicluster domain-containing protein [Bacteroidetes bacterium]|nr:4Fe-4S dicluster domain-containing protein [Bacteroidota bacterium]
MENENNNKDRRNFLKLGIFTTATVAAVGTGLSKVFSENNPPQASGKKVKVMTADGKLVEVDSAHLKCCSSPPVSNEEARKGIEGKKFVMVIDLAKCDGCATCTVSCQKMHHTPPEREWIKVFKMQDSEKTAPYFFPKPCYHCDNPPCTKVCPVNATFKRQDGIVLIDNTRCIGCRFCMAACPYSTRFFNWDKPEESAEVASMPYSPEQSFPRKMGTVEKCDFCPHMLREGKLPDCVANCAMNAIYMGDANEDAVTSSSGETVQLSKLLEDNAGFRYMEELGTEPRVYYLPPKNRRYPKPEMHNEKQSEKKGHDMMNMKM